MDTLMSTIKIVVFCFCIFSFIVCSIVAISSVCGFLSHRNDNWPQNHKLWYWFLFLGVMTGPLLMAWISLIALNILGYCHFMDPIQQAILSDEPFLFAGMLYYLLIPSIIGSTSSLFYKAYKRTHDIGKQENAEEQQELAGA